MSKFTIFTLFVSSIIIVIVAEIMVNEYLKTPYSLEVATNIFSAATPETPLVEPTQQAVAAPVIQTDQPTIVAPAAFLTQAMVSQAGFQNLALKSVPYSGKLFDRVAFKDLGTVPTFETQLVKNEMVKDAGIYEFHVSSQTLSKEVYGLMKGKCAAEIGVILNETNSFGDASFYVNYFEVPERVFLVVKKGDNVYALTYGKELHASIQKLISLLP